MKFPTYTKLILIIAVLMSSAGFIANKYQETQFDISKIKQFNETKFTKHTDDFAEWYCKNITGDDGECKEIIVLELDSSYYEGFHDSKTDRKWVNMIATKTKKLDKFCKDSPTPDVCKIYRDVLLDRYVEGLRGE